MNAILVAVDYADLLALTLPYNRRHFDRVMVVTDRDRAHRDADIAQANHCEVYRTDSFYDGCAAFNKWVALEQGLDALGREGWLCLMDADVLWPQSLPKLEQGWGTCDVVPGCLYSPRRRMMLDPQVCVNGAIPPEGTWGQFPLHPHQNAFAGYSQIFHASDPHLPAPPWHQVDWIHAGGADSYFHRLWPMSCKVRPPFEVLHLGPANQNWFGRSTPYLDGTVHADSKLRRQRNDSLWAERRRTGFAKEKL
jgi:hypothetical protein